MKPLSFKLSLSQNKALNHDGITALRSLSLVQGETYAASVTLYNGADVVTPAISNFAFIIRNGAGQDIITVNEITATDTGYTFTLPVIAPAIVSSGSYRGLFTFTADGHTEIITPFPVTIAVTGTSGSVGFVSSIYGLTNDVAITGAGSVSVSKSGQTLTIYGAAATGDYVTLTGAQTITGAKSFTAAVSVPSLYANYLYNNIGVQAIDLGNKELKGSDWRAGGAPISTTSSFSVAGSLTRIVAGTPDTPAEAPQLSATFNSQPNENDTLTIYIGATSVTFEFASSAPGNGNTWIDTSGISSTDTYADAMISAINASILYALTQSGAYSSGAGNFYFFASATGSGSSVSYSTGNPSFLGSYNQSWNGTDLIPGTPEGGAREVTLLSAQSHIMITNVVIQSPASTAWAQSDIAIGFLDGSNNFYPVYGIATSNLTNSSAFRFIGNEIFIYPNGFQYLNEGNAIGGAYLVAMMVQPGTAGLTPLDETSGDDVEIVVQGYTF